MLKTDTKKIIERILKKAEKEFSYNKSYSKIYIENENAIIINPHFCYILPKEKINNIDPAFIVSDKEKYLCNIIADKGFLKVFPTKNPVDTITLNYKDVLKLKNQQLQNKYGLKYVRIESSKKIIYIVLDNLINAFKILQENFLTMRIYENNNYFKNLNPHENKKEIIFSPYTIENKNYKFCACPVNIL